MGADLSDLGEGNTEPRLPGTEERSRSPRKVLTKLTFLAAKIMIVSTAPPRTAVNAWLRSVPPSSSRPKLFHSGAVKLSQPAVQSYIVRVRRLLQIGTIASTRLRLCSLRRSYTFRLLFVY